MSSFKLSMKYPMTSEFPNKVPHNVTLTVCITAYNHGKYISKAIDSALSQETTFPFEICIGEDESGDDTREICLTYAKKYPARIRLFLRSRKDVVCIGGSPSGHYNLMETISAGRGEFCAILEGDDYWVDSQKLQRQVDFLKGNLAYSLCGTNVLRVFNSEVREDYVEPRVGGINDNYNHEDFVRHGSIFRTCSLCFRREKLIGFPPWFFEIYFLDAIIQIYLTADGTVGKLLPSVSAAYRVHGAGSWSGASSVRSLIRISEDYRKLSEHIDSPKLSKICLRKADLLNSHAFWYLLKQCKFSESYSLVISKLKQGSSVSSILFSYPIYRFKNARF